MAQIFSISTAIPWEMIQSDQYNGKWVFFFVAQMDLCQIFQVLAQRICEGVFWIVV